MSTPEEWKLVFNKNGIKLYKMVERPSDKQLIYVEIDTVRYDKFKNMNVGVSRIELEDGEIVFYASELKLIDSSKSSLLSPNLLCGDKIDVHARTLVIGKQEIHCNRFVDILINTVTWLFEHNRIQEKDLPINVANGELYLINLTPFHKDGRAFRGKAYKIKEGVYLNTNASGREGYMKYSKYLIDRFASDVKFEIKC